MAPKMDKNILCVASEWTVFHFLFSPLFFSDCSKWGNLAIFWANFVLNKLFLLGPLKNFVFKLHQTADKFVKIFWSKFASYSQLGWDGLVEVCKGEKMVVRTLEDHLLQKQQQRKYIPIFCWEHWKLTICYLSMYRVFFYRFHPVGTIIMVLT